MRIRCILAFLAAWTAIFTACEFEQEREEFHYSHSLQPGGRLYVENFNGSVEISGWDQDTADISGTKYAGTQGGLDALRIDIVASGDSIRIRTVRPSGHHEPMGAHYVIKVPRRTALERIESNNGAIRANDIEGWARLETTNGSIRASLAGAERGEPLEFTTSNGSIELTLESFHDNSIEAKTTNGSITLRLPPSIQADVKAVTSNGSITTDFDVALEGARQHNRLEGTIGSGGPHLDLTTSNGSIRLLKL
jgi:hypothetical protein